MRKFIIVLSILTICFPVITYGQAPKTVKPPYVEAKGAALMEFNTGRMLFEKDADLPLANASTTKIMTAIVALENTSLTDVVTASKNAAMTPPVKMHLAEGEKQTMEDLLYAMMLESANDAAVAIAEHVGGSVEGFAEMMNEKARELGAVNTELVTPSGLDEGEHRSTAKDMALIARYALSNSDFRRIIATPHVSTPVKGGDFKAHSFINKDRLLREYEGALGIKTGYTGKAGHCFVGAAQRDGMLIVSVVLGSGWGGRGKEQKWVDTKNLLNYGFENFSLISVAKEGDFVGEADVLNSKGGVVSLNLSNGLALPLSEEERGKVEVRNNLPETFDAPVVKGDKLGESVIFVDGRPLAKIDIIAMSDVERYDFNISMGKILTNWVNMDIKAIIN